MRLDRCQRQRVHDCHPRCLGSVASAVSDLASGPPAQRCVLSKSAKIMKAQENANGGDWAGNDKTELQGMRVQGNAGGLEAGRRVLTEEFRPRGRRSSGAAMLNRVGSSFDDFFLGSEKES